MVPTRCWSRPPNFSMIRPTSTRRCLAFEICVKRFYDLDVDWQSETRVSTGTTEGLAACFFGLIELGDEVALIEPLYDCYLNDSMRGKRDRLSGALSKIPDVEPELFNRLRFAKQDQVLDDAASRLAAHFS